MKALESRGGRGKKDCFMICGQCVGQEGSTGNQKEHTVSLGGCSSHEGVRRGETRVMSKQKKTQEETRETHEKKGRKNLLVRGGGRVELPLLRQKGRLTVAGREGVLAGLKGS